MAHYVAAPYDELHAPYYAVEKKGEVDVHTFWGTPKRWRIIVLGDKGIKNQAKNTATLVALSLNMAGGIQRAIEIIRELRNREAQGAVPAFRPSVTANLSLSSAGWQWVVNVCRTDADGLPSNALELLTTGPIEREDIEPVVRLLSLSLNLDGGIERALETLRHSDA